MTNEIKQRIKLLGCEAGTPLFDTKDNEPDYSHFTPSLKPLSLEANDLIPVFTKDTQSEKVYEAIRLGLRVNDRQIHIITGIDRHLIPDRRKRLKNRIRFAGKAIDPVTHKKTATWEINK